MEKNIFNELQNHLYKSPLSIIQNPSCHWVTKKLNPQEYFTQIHQSFKSLHDIHQQFLCDFPRQNIIIHGIPVKSIHHFVDILNTCVHPEFHLWVTTMCTQASLASMFEFLQDQFGLIIDSSSSISKNTIVNLDSFSETSRMNIRITIKSPHEICFIIEKRLSQVHLESMKIVKTIQSFTCFEISHHPQISLIACRF